MSGRASDLTWADPPGSINEWVPLGDESHDYFLEYVQSRCKKRTPFPSAPVVFPDGRQRQTALARVFKFRPRDGAWLTKLKVLDLSKKNTESDFPRSSYPKQGSYGVVLDSQRHPGELIKKIGFFDPMDAHFDILALMAREVAVFAQQYADFPLRPDFPGYRLYAYALNAKGRAPMMHGLWEQSCNVRFGQS